MMNHQTNSGTASERLTRLEKSAGRWRGATLLLAGVVGFGLLSGQSRTEHLADLELLALEAVLNQEPHVVGVSISTDPASGSRNVAIRVWSDGRTELMLLPNPQSCFLSADDNSPMGYDPVTHRWYPGSFECEDENTDAQGPYEEWRYWRPLVDEDLDPDGP